MQLIKNKNAVVIDYYHPVGQYPNRINYYVLTSIYKTALI